MYEFWTITQAVKFVLTAIVQIHLYEDSILYVCVAVCVSVSVHVPYIAAVNSQTEECRWTVSNHLLKGFHIQPKVLHMDRSCDESDHQILNTSWFKIREQSFKQGNCGSCL